jgi:hypothetical protein
MPRGLPSSALPIVVGALSLGTIALVPARAYADETVAAPCDTDPFFCQTAGLQFDRIDALPIEWHFDTGWVPQNSPLKVKILAGVYANTQVSLAGRLVTTWPESLSFEAPGEAEGSLLSYHYGTEFKAQGMIDITLAGTKYSWVGDIPYVPKVDLKLQGEQPFDAWGYAPGATLSSKSQTQKIASVGIATLIGLSIPGIDGGFELDAAMEIAATYVTEQMVIATPDGNVVEGGPLTTEGGTSSTPYLSGPSIDLDVHPEGTVDYEGVVHLIPAFFIALLGQNFKIPIADIPIAFPITKKDWVFDPERVHVPLPDLVLPEAIDVGSVEVGQDSLVPYSLFNAGEAQVHAVIASSDPALLPPYDTILNLDPGITVDSAVRFIPDRSGDFTAKLMVTSNDPGSPVQIIALKGKAFIPTIAEGSGCACRAAGGAGDSASPSAIAAVAIGAMALRSRPRKRRRK